jgi:predicted ATP-dependent endonuclease of OLD family
MTPWTNEGFFANVVVLVEGEDDRAAILGMAKAMGYEFESMDIAVIPCMGKKNL